EELVSWILNHAGATEAIARYQVQLDAIDDALEKLGLTQFVIPVHTNNVVFDVVGSKRYKYLGAATGIVLSEEDYTVTSKWSLQSGTSAQPGDILSSSTAGDRVVKRELDTLFLNIPSLYASPGSVFIERDGLSSSDEALAKST